MNMAKHEEAMEDKAVANGRNPYYEGQHGAEEPADTAARLALVTERDALRALLLKIGDYAHDHSTGPAVPDALWEVRSMAYGASVDG